MAQDNSKTQSNDDKNIGYELFLACLSVLSIFNLFLYLFIRVQVVQDVVFIIDSFLTIFFLGDFLHRFFTTHQKSDYFFRRYGWADLLSSIPLPQAKILRLFRLQRAYRLVKRLGVDRIREELLYNRASSALYILLLAIVLVLEFGGMAILRVEYDKPNANIVDASDAVWYTFVTITTVGYGDRYPVSNEGRVIGMLIMTVGVALFGTLSGFLATTFLSSKPRPDPSAPVEDPATDPRAALEQLKQMLADQKVAQDAIVSKIDAIEKLL